jgi:hypothetical protein
MNNKKIILDLCGGTGAWSKPYKDAGYDVRLITLPMFDITAPYVIEQCISLKPYGILAAPPCTEFSFAKSHGKARDIKEGMKCIKSCLEIIWGCQEELPTPLAKRTNLAFWALENPFGLLRRYLGHAPLTFHPYEFGDGHKKKTNVWGFFNMPKKNPTDDISIDYIHGMSPNGRPLKKFDQLLTKEIAYTEETKHLSRQARRSITPPGFAKAFFKANK